MSLRLSDDEFAALRQRIWGILGEPPPGSEKKANKYHAKLIGIDGYTFQSKAEAARYQELKFRLLAGEIGKLEVHPKIDIMVAGRHICDYIADFAYTVDGDYIVEDVKGVRTPVYKLKRKLVEALYGIVIKEVHMK